MKITRFATRLASLVLLTWGISSVPAFAAENTAPVLVQDFAPGSSTAKLSPTSLAVVDQLLYFSGFDPQHGREPWVSDGSAAGTRRLADLCPGPCSSYPSGFLGLGDKVLFGGTNGYQGALFAAAGGQVEEIASYRDAPGNFVRLGEVVFFATSGLGSEMVYRSDGTRAGTYPAADFCSGSPCYPPAPFVSETAAGIYFVKDHRLYRLPAEGQPVLVHPDLDSASRFTRLDASRVVFEGCKFEPYVCRAWVSDGTTAGTFPVEPATGGPSAQRADILMAWRGRVYYSNQNFAWFSTDGTVAGTRPETFGNFFFGLFAATDDHLFYLKRVPTETGDHQQLWARSGDGSEVRLLTSSGDFSLIGRLGNKIFVRYPQDQPSAPTVWLLAATDGQAAGTAALGEFVATGPGVVFQSQLYFGSVVQVEAEWGLWRSQGRLADTAELLVTSPAPNSSWPEPYRLGAQLAVNTRSATGPSVWRVDPLDLGLALADSRQLWLQQVGKGGVAYANLYDQPASTAAVTEAAVVELVEGVPYGRFADDGHFFFSTHSPFHNLWESDGTAAGTRLLFELGGIFQCGPIVHYCSQEYSDIAPSGDKVYFLTPSVGGDYDDWDLNVHVRGSGEYRPIRHAARFAPVLPLPGGRVAFLAEDKPEKKSVWWITDGSEAGTFPAFALPDSHPQSVMTVVAGSRLFFLIRGDGDALWTSGFSAGSAELLTVAEPGSMTELTTAGERAYFSGNAGQGQELGSSDGTAGGTHWLDLRPGATGSSPKSLFALADGRVVFAAAGDAAGDELWISDGTPSGSNRLTDLAPGPAAASPDHFAQVGKRLFFQATDGNSGRELWAIDLPTRVLPCPEGRICLESGHFDIAVTAHTADGDFVGKKAGGTADSAVLTFFSANNWEMLVKVLDGCAINQNYWVFAASATDVGFTLTVTDRTTGAQKTYRNRLGQPAVAITDTAAFSCN